MARTKHAKPDEFQKEQIRHLRKELKRKDQRIRQLERELNYNQNRSPESTRERRKEPPKCFQCGKGELSIMDIGIRRYTICPVCKDRVRID